MLFDKDHTSSNNWKLLVSLSNVGIPTFEPKSNAAKLRPDLVNIRYWLEYRRTWNYPGPAGFQTFEPHQSLRKMLDTQYQLIIRHPSNTT